MKKLFITVALLAISCVATASPTDDANAYIASLSNASMKCSGMALSIALDYHQAHELFEQNVQNYGYDANGSANGMPDPSADVAKTVANVNKVDKCKSDAENKGSQIYKDFMAKTKNKSLRDDAKEVFTAWVAYTNTIHISDEFADGSGIPEETREKSVLNEASSKLRSDALL